MRRIRDRIFLATKTGDPTATEAYDSIRRSIERLQVTRVDLVQLHSVGAFDDLDRRTASGRALEGAIRAREEGLVAAIGITGHGRRRCIWRRCDDSLRHGPHPVQLPPHSLPGVPARFRGARRGGPRAGCRTHGDQGRRQEPVEGGRGSPVRHVVRAARWAVDDRCGDGVRPPSAGGDGRVHSGWRASRSDADRCGGTHRLHPDRRGRCHPRAGARPRTAVRAASRGGSCQGGSSRCWIA